MFIDTANITVRSGKGGNGIASFRKEKFIPRGGPDGGDGGSGGDVILVAQNRVRTLLRFRFDKKFAATPGSDGGTKNCHGKNGKDITIAVPIGTMVYDEGTGDLLVDLDHEGMKAVVVKGGRGGRGNARYATPVRQVPHFCEKGQPIDERVLRMEMKLLADIALLGMPNAGKSTLLARTSAATPKIADYPFTTLEPQLGVVAVGERSFVMADLPGLIEGAAEGRGKGIDFLRHTERSRVLLHIVDVSGGFGGDMDPWESFNTINHEVASYGAGLETRPMIVALNKCDLPDSEVYLEDICPRLDELGLPYYQISAVTGQGVDTLLFAVDAKLQEMEDLAALEEKVEQRDHVVVRRTRRELEINLIDEGLWELSGTSIERLIATCYLDNEEALDRLQRSMERMGITATMRAQGIKDGDKVRIGQVELDFVD